jgi:hypothetical protein
LLTGGPLRPYPGRSFHRLDCTSFCWRLRKSRLAAFEDAWLGSGEDEQYGMQSFFIHKYYSDEEKQTLWAERGDKSLYRWRERMRKPEPLTDSERQNEC